jgi:pyruvate-formate lyase-activating enzyme
MSMTVGEHIRNLVESNRFKGSVEGLYNAIGVIPAYRRIVMRQALRRIEYVRQQRSYRLSIELSSVCNAHCVFCPHPTMEREKRIMTDEIFELIISRIIEEKIEPAVFDLFNVGEPLVDRSLFHRIRRLKAVFPSAKTTITTNLALANPEIIDELLSSGLDRITISLNAVLGESYRKIMGLDYDKTVRNVEMLLKKRQDTKSPLYVMLSLVVCEQNRNQASEFMRTWKNRVDRVYVQRAVDWGGALDIKGAYAASPYPCKDLFERIVILSNGEFALCCQDFKGIIRLNVRNNLILDAFYTKPYVEIRKVHLDGDISSLQMCRNCFGVNLNGATWLLEKNK